MLQRAQPSDKVPCGLWEPMLPFWVALPKVAAAALLALLSASGTTSAIFVCMDMAPTFTVSTPSEVTPVTYSHKLRASCHGRRGHGGCGRSGSGEGGEQQDNEVRGMGLAQSMCNISICHLAVMSTLTYMCIVPSMMPIACCWL